MKETERAEMKIPNITEISDETWSKMTDDEQMEAIALSMNGFYIKGRLKSSVLMSVDNYKKLADFIQKMNVKHKKQ